MEEMKELVARLNRHAHYYYVLDDPRISDGEYDALYDRLTALERETGVVLPDSPTRRVGGAPLAEFQKHTHLAPLYSLDKAKTHEELLAWEERIKKYGLEDVRYSLEYKFDGLTLNLTYEGGVLVGAASRGDGAVGEEILPQVQTIRSVPLSIPFQGRMEVQGEGIMRLSALEEYNKTAKEPLKNARNGAAGALRNLDPVETARRKLDAFFYNVGYIEGLSFADHGEMIGFLQENGFRISGYERVYDSIDAVMQAIDEAGDSRDALDFLIDGMVIKVYRFADREKLGYTQKFPRWAIAYKFEAEEATTVVQEISWEVGRTGKLTPLAHLEDVQIGGATIRKATLNNYEDICRKRIRLGARVFIRRSNDVIPEILGAVSGQDALPPVEKPERCPACGTKLEQIGPNLFCPNTLSCKPQLVARMAHFVSRDAMNIEYVSEKTIELLFRERNIADISALYTLDMDMLMGLEGFKEKRAEKTLDSIARSKKPALANFIYALGINNVGKKTARDLAAQYGTFAAVRRATMEERGNMRDIGEIVAQCIVDFFASPEVEHTLEQLFALGVEPQAFEGVAAGAFAGKNIVITGTLSSMKRSAAAEAVERAGGTVQSAVAKSTDMLIAGEKAGSKLKKAKELGIQIVTEEEFLAMLTQPGAR